MISLFAKAETRCPVGECENLISQIKKWNDTLARLEGIKAMNLAYLATLDADQSSQRIKVLSNVHIADTRMERAKSEKSSLKAKEANMKCNACGDSHD